MAIEWFARWSAVAQRTVVAISAVVRTAGAPEGDRRDARVSVTHWCSASATTAVPSLKVSRKHGRPRSTSVAATTVTGRPSAPSSWSPTATSPIVVQPVGVGSGVSRASALPKPGLPAMTMSWPGCRPLVSASRSVKPVGTPVIEPPRLPMASSSSSVGCISCSSSV